MKYISLPKCNLYLVGSGNDRNGNKIVKLTFPNSRSFSIQTQTRSLKNTSSILRGLKTKKDMETLSASELAKISKEVCGYIKNYGSATQQSKLRTY